MSSPYLRLDRCASFPYGWRQYVRRALWEAVRRTVFNCIPSRLARCRCAILRLFGARLGQNVNIRPGVRIVHPWLLDMGDWSCLGDGVMVYNLGQISIGAHTVISQRSHLCAGTHDYMRSNLPLLCPAIRIGSGVWICTEAFIGPGVTIGDNSIVGARAVVMRDVPEAVIAAGNPAKVVKTRPAPADWHDERCA